LKKRKILFPNTMNYLYSQWFEEEGFDHEFIFSCSESMASNAGEELLKHIIDNGGDNYLVLFNMPNKKMSTMDGVDVATDILFKLKLSVPVIIISDQLQNKLNELYHWGYRDLPKNIVAMGDCWNDKDQIINKLKLYTSAPSLPTKKYVSINH